MKVEQIVKKCRGTTDRAKRTRLDLCNKLKHELLAHAAFEEAVFYPAIRERNGADISEALEEHQQVKSMLEEIEQMEPASAEFTDKILELEEAVKHHVEEEENELFPVARKAIEKDEGEQMSQRHDQMRSEEHTSELQSLMRISYAVF